MIVEPIERLESLISFAEAMPEKSLTVNVTLYEIYRIANRGFSNEEADYWANRLDELMSCN